MNYELYDSICYNSVDSWNSSYRRNLKIKYRNTIFEIPRNHNCEFKQDMIAPYKCNTDDLEMSILYLHSKGITTFEIIDLIVKMYGQAYSKQTISNITETMENHVIKFSERSLNKQYVVVYMDVAMINVKWDSVFKEDFFILVRITKEGYKEERDFGIYSLESCESYKEMFQCTKKRRCSEIIF